MTAPTVAQRIAHALPRHGVDVIFGQTLPSAVILACEAIGIRRSWRGAVHPARLCEDCERRGPPRSSENKSLDMRERGRC
jgi:hypothetical protein